MSAAARRIFTAGTFFYDVAAVCWYEAGGEVRAGNKEWNEGRSILATNSKIGMEKFLKDFFSERFWGLK